MTNGAEATTATWRAAGESHDLDLAASCLAEDVQIISPLTARFRFRGRDQARDMLAAAFDVIDTIRYHTELGDQSARALFFHGRCRRQEFEEAQLLRFDAEGRIVELTLFGRPLPGLTAVMAALGPRLARRNGRGKLTAGALRVMAGPLAAMTRSGDKVGIKMALPKGRVLP
jgi:hypothetical protein